MIKAPFKRKSAPTIVVGANGASGASGATTSSMSPKGTPTSLRGCSVTRSLSLGSSVNSLDELRNSCDSTNIYAEIDVNRVLLLLCEQKNNQTLNMLNNDNGSLVDDSDATRRRNDENGSKNNLLEFDGGSMSAATAVNIENDDDDDMWKSVNVHLDNIDKVNKSLDEKLLSNTIRSNIPSNESVDTEHRSSIREILKSTFSREENVETERLLEDDCDKDDEKPEPKTNALNMDFFNVSLDSNDDDGRETSSADGPSVAVIANKKKETKDSKKGGVNDPIEAKKSRSKSFKSNKSVNAILTSFKDFKNSKRKIDEEIFEHVENMPLDRAVIAKDPSLTAFGKETSTQNPRPAGHHVSCEEDVNLLPTHSKSPIRGKNATKKPKKPSKLKKLKLKLKLPSSSGSAAAQLAAAVAKRPICRHCFKKLHRCSAMSANGNEEAITAAVKSLVQQSTETAADDFCVCHQPSDDGLCINEHTYSDLDGVSIPLINSSSCMLVVVLRTAIAKSNIDIFAAYVNFVYVSLQELFLGGLIFFCF